MRLSLGILAFNSADYVEPLLKAARSFADEIVVGVDTNSTDSTEEICRNYADKLFRLEPIGSSERALAWLNAQCTGDWILRLDDDELPSTGLIQALPHLLSDRQYTHYWSPRRWVIGDTWSNWISQHPWWPDWQMRLFRNIWSIVSFPGHLHSDYIVQGAGGYFSDGSIYHYDLVCHSEERRRKKLAQYERISPNNSLPHFYFPRQNQVITRTIPADDLPWLGPSPPVKKDGADLATLAQCCPYVSLEEMRQAERRSCQYPAELFRATLDCLYYPAIVEPGRTIPVELRLRNDSGAIWCSPGLGAPVIAVSYHVLDALGEVYEYDGARTSLPLTLRPSESTKLIAQVVPPWEPGHYVIKWDPLIEHVSWFSRQGWTGPEIMIEVRSRSEEMGQLAKFLQLSQRIPGWFRHEEAETLAHMSYSLPGEAVIVEIGSFLGSGSILLAGPRKLRGSGRVHCIDRFDCSGDAFSVPFYREILTSLGGQSLRARFEINITGADLSEWVEVHDGLAADIAKNWTTPIDLLVLDGDQSVRGAREIYERWSPFLKSGGIIAVHNSNDRVFADDHDGNRRVVLEEIVPPRYIDVRLVGTTTFARNTQRQFEDRLNPRSSADAGECRPTRDDVEMAYRFILGREPESERVINEHLDCLSVAELRSRMLSSVEFRMSRGTRNCGVNERQLTENDSAYVGIASFDKRAPFESMFGGFFGRLGKRTEGFKILFAELIKKFGRFGENSSR